MRDIIAEFSDDIPRVIGLTISDIESQISSQLKTQVVVKYDSTTRRVSIHADWGQIVGRTDQMRVVHLKGRRPGSKAYGIALMPPMRGFSQPENRDGRYFIPAPANTVAPTRSKKLLLL